MNSKKPITKRILTLIIALLVAVLVIGVATPVAALYIRGTGKVEGSYEPGAPSNPSWTNPPTVRTERIVFLSSSGETSIDNLYVQIPDQGYPVYVRVAVVVNWLKYADCICAPSSCTDGEDNIGCTDCPGCEEGKCEEGNCKDCKEDCVNCPNCRKGCKSCPNCKEGECTDCTGKDCTDCPGCGGTITCKECKDCEGCENCQDGEQCSENCTGCPKCRTDCKSCPNCKEGDCKDCTEDCTSCPNCRKHGKNCDKCKDCKWKNCLDCEECPHCNDDPYDDWDIIFPQPTIDQDYKLETGNTWEKRDSTGFFYHKESIVSGGDASQKDVITIDFSSNAPFIKKFERMSTAKLPGNIDWLDVKDCVLRVELLVQTVQAIGYTDDGKNAAWKDAWGDGPSYWPN